MFELGSFSATLCACVGFLWISSSHCIRPKIFALRLLSFVLCSVEATWHSVGSECGGAPRQNSLKSIDFFSKEMLRNSIFAHKSRNSLKNTFGILQKRTLTQIVCSSPGALFTLREATRSQLCHHKRRNRNGTDRNVARCKNYKLMAYAWILAARYCLINAAHEW